MILLFVHFRNMKKIRNLIQLFVLKISTPLRWGSELVTRRLVVQVSWVFSPARALDSKAAAATSLSLTRRVVIEFGVH